MRKVLIALATAGAALAVATPASAQYYGNPNYGYNNGYAYNNGYNNRGQMQRELQQIRIQADQLARQGRLTRSESRDLYGDLASAERSLYRGGNPWQLNQKIQQIRYELNRYSDYDGRGRYGYNNYNGYNNYGYRDRDRDGRDDRYEDDHGYRRDR
jgi:hypothetical protein